VIQPMTKFDFRRSDLRTETTASKVFRAASRHLWAVLLAGGDGIRLRDLTLRIAGDFRPKQFCCIVGAKSLFEQSRARLEPLVPPDRHVFVLSRAHERYYGEYLAEAGESSALVQPLNRGTGIAIVLALVHILKRDPDAVVGIFPCDHFYSNDDSFRRTIRAAANCAEQHAESMILVGAEAEYPEVEYGWIEPDVVVSQSQIGPLFRVNRFWEKPPLHRARALMGRGCLWNTFVTMTRASALLDVLCSQVPDAVISVTRALADSNLEPAYDLLAAVDFSRDVLAHQTHRLMVLRDRMSGWADLGSPARVLDTLARNGIRPEWLGEGDGFTRLFNELPGIRT
jgi:mannose-1-phosphate guanylyltransferase